MDWRTEQISRTMTFGDDREVGRMVILDGRKCLEGRSFSFDVDDRYAFDIDEPVQLEVEFYQHREAVTPDVTYEMNGEAETTLRMEIPGYTGGSRTHKAMVTLDRARFANRGLLLTDFSIGLNWASKYKITICGISLKRSHTTVVPKEFGAVEVEITDEAGESIPARVGIYDKTGRLPLPSEEAIAVKRWDEMIRVVSVTPFSQLIPWPVHNRSAFYVNGSYHATLPSGEYELVVARGPEHRIFRQRFTVVSHQTRSITVKLKRWDDLPARGWYSGDNHIHYIRHDEGDDPNLLLFTQAEDVHVANILQMGNIATATWPQYGWAPAIAETNRTYAFVPGQEDPRTERRGHTIGLNLKNSIRDTKHYLLYHEVFEEVRAQGGVTGYAHVVGKTFGNPTAGLALDVPYKLVDVVEIMQDGYAGSSVWFDFLNLGYKLAPSAGTDYMSDFTLPGAERSYVYVPPPFSLERWFAALRRGEAFVTNGPMLELTVNGRGMGSELHLKAGDRLIIDASASINPDIDSLESLDLIEQGEIVKTIKAEKSGKSRLRLRYEMTARHGTWFVIRAQGKTPRVQPNFSFPEYKTADQLSAKVAISGAVYVNVDGQGFWKPTAVPTIVEHLRQSLAQLMVPKEAEEGGETGTLETTMTFWDSQKGLLKQRIDEVMPIYDELVAKAKMAIEKR